jgi:hypothetical protein
MLPRLSAEIVLLSLIGCAASSRIDWSLEETRRTVAVTQRSVVNERRPILYVLRDSVAGQWMFLPDENPHIDIQIMVTIEDILKIDETIRELADLRPGWMATRVQKGQPWIRHKF